MVIKTKLHVTKIIWLLPNNLMEIGKNKVILALDNQHMSAFVFWN